MLIGTLHTKITSIYYWLSRRNASNTVHQLDHGDAAIQCAYYSVSFLLNHGWNFDHIDSNVLDFPDVTFMFVYPHEPCGAFVLAFYIILGINQLPKFQFLQYSNTLFFGKRCFFHFIIFVNLKDPGLNHRKHIGTREGIYNQKKEIECLDDLMLYPLLFSSTRTNIPVNISLSSTSAVCSVIRVITCSLCVYLRIQLGLRR